MTPKLPVANESQNTDALEPQTDGWIERFELTRIPGCLEGLCETEE